MNNQNEGLLPLIPSEAGSIFYKYFIEFVEHKNLHFVFAEELEENLQKKNYKIG